MAVLRFLWKKSFPLDWQPYYVYAINRDRDDFRPNYFLVTNKQTMDRYRRIVGVIETYALEYYVCTGAPLRLLFFSNSHSGIRILFHLAHFARPASRGNQLQMRIIISPPRAHCQTQECGRLVGKFQQEFKGSKVSLQ